MEIGSLIVGTIGGAITSWLISSVFSKRSSKELDHKLDVHSSKFSTANTFNSFERMLRTSEWRKEHIEHNEVWICEDNNAFQIHSNDDARKFVETWTSVFPDQNTTMFYIDLKIGGTIVKSIPFIHADGGRYTLPLPELRVIEEKSYFFWSPNSVEVKIAEIIGNFYRFNSLKEVAKFTKIELHTVVNNTK